MEILQLIVGLLTAGGTLALALASYLVIAREGRRQQFEQTPNLVFREMSLSTRPISRFFDEEFEPEARKLRFKVTNPSAYPVLLVEAALHSFQSEEVGLNKVVNPGEILDFQEEVRLSDGGAGRGGGLMLFFQYGATGQEVHRLEMPVSQRSKNGDLTFNPTKPRYKRRAALVSDYLYSPG